jgi:Tol biopolymer transport system component
MSPSFSPNGKKIAYHQATRDSKSAQKCQLYIYSFIANKSNKIAPCDPIAYKPINWSKDGKSVFATRIVKATMRSGVVKVDIQSGEVEHLGLAQKLIDIMDSQSPLGQGVRRANSKLFNRRTTQS